jgi:hypothetical protein
MFNLKTRSSGPRGDSIDDGEDDIVLCLVAEAAT